MTRFLTVVFFCLRCGLFSAPQITEYKFLASDGSTSDWFGWSIASSGNMAAIGSIYDDDRGRNSGSVYIFGYDRHAGKWWQKQKITADDETSFDHFGVSVAMDDKRMVIGSPYDDVSGNSSGSAYVFEYDNFLKLWTQKQKLIPFDGMGGNNFGYSVAIYKDLIVVSAAFDNSGVRNRGSVYIFKYNKFDGFWEFKQKITASDGKIYDSFGFDVALFGKTVVVGAPGNDPAGAVYVFEYNGRSKLWEQKQKLVPLDNDGGDKQFGRSVAASGGRMLVGAYYDNAGGDRRGSAYLFNYDHYLRLWMQRQKLVPSDAADGAYFGWSVDMREKIALIGAPYHYYAQNRNTNNAAYLYKYNRRRECWEERKKIVPQDVSAGNNFGFCVFLSGNRAIIGAPSDPGKSVDNGAVYVYKFHSL